MKLNIDPRDNFSSDRVKIEIEEKEIEKRQRADKIENYAKYVKEMYRPKVSEKKKLELEQI